jgi:hypothetical protein
MNLQLVASFLQAFYDFSEIFFSPGLKRFHLPQCSNFTDSSSLIFFVAFRIRSPKLHALQEPYLRLAGGGGGGGGGHLEGLGSHG